MTEQEWLTGTDPRRMLSHFSRTSTVAHHRMPSNRKLRLFACAVARLYCYMKNVSDVEACVEAGQPDHNFDDRGARLDGQFWRVCYSVEAASLACAAHPIPQVADLLREIIGNPWRPMVLPHCCVKCGCEEYEPETEYAACARCGNDMTARRHVSLTVLALAQAAYDERPSGWMCVRHGLVPESEVYEAEGGGHGHCLPAEDCWQRVSLEGGTLDPLRLAVLADALEEAGLECDHKSQCPDCGGMGGYNEMGPNTFWQTCSECGGKGSIPEPDTLLAHLRSPGPHVRGCHALDTLLGRE